ncbi:hypothetical protein LMED105_08525 [Limnobacter sp. MED105]|nr:hypothetical protein LMED105_08525 [Limnobacter sp. MED105]
MFNLLLNDEFSVGGAMQPNKA